MVKQQDLVTAALRPCHEELQAALAQATAAHLDETGTKEGPNKAWIWTAATATFTVFLVRLTRKADVAKELLGKFQGVIITDRYCGYHWHQLRQLCWAHLLRDFQGLIDTGDAGKLIGTQLQNLGHRLFHHWHRARDGTITRNTMRRNIRALMWPFYETLEQGQRSEHARTATLCNELFMRYGQLWTFLDHEGVEPTNNAAERSLRHAVIWRKLSFGTQSHNGSRFVETLLSVIETCRQQDQPVVDFVTEAVAARFAGKTAPSLLTRA
jgi:transposase